MTHQCLFFPLLGSAVVCTVLSYFSEYTLFLKQKYLKDSSEVSGSIILQHSFASAAAVRIVTYLLSLRVEQQLIHQTEMGNKSHISKFNGDLLMILDSCSLRDTLYP